MFIECAVVATVAIAAPVQTAAQSLYPHLRIIVPSNPGGGWDTTARAVQPVLQLTGLARVSSVENIPGAGGLIGLARFVSAERGRDDVVMTTGGTMVYAISTSRSVFTFADVTPIARLLGEYDVVIVAARSPFRSLSDFIRAFRAHPETISWAGGAAEGPEHMLARRIADAAGVDARRVNFVPFTGGGEMMPAVLGGQVSVGINVLASTAPYIDAGTVRVLAVSSAERLPSLDAPTLREQGLDIEFENWRGLVAPPGISVTGRQRLEAAIETLAHSREWRDTLARYRWNDRFLSGPAFARFLAADEALVRDMVRRFGSPATEESPLMGRYPFFVLTALAVVSLVFAIQFHRSRGGSIERAGAGWRAVLLVAAAVLVDLVFIERLGFIVAATGLFWLTARAFDRAHPLRDAGWALALSVTAYVVFARLLELPLPAGVLGRWL